VPLIAIINENFLLSSLRLGEPCGNTSRLVLHSSHGKARGWGNREAEKGRLGKSMTGGEERKKKQGAGNHEIVEEGR
jgi:hypothetical protein